MLVKMVASERIRALNRFPERADGEYVLYWMQVNRRLDCNHALAFAVESANRLGLPVLIFEGLTPTLPRFDDFIRDGARDNAARAVELRLGYEFSDQRGALYRCAERAAVLVTDDFPGFLVSDHNARMPAKIGIPYCAVDSSCVVPMSCFTKQEYAAYTIRPKIHRLLPGHLRPVEMVAVRKPWTGPRAGAPAGNSTGGGRQAALRRLHEFLAHDLAHYAENNREPSQHATSRLSPFLHFGHISSLEIALAVREQSPEFQEQLIVRRELAFNFARFGPDPRSLTALPDWAQKTLAKHAADAREWTYTLSQFERAATHDALWNAMQRELLRDGVIHGYYRMYWGKKIIEWSASHQDALDTMIYLHDRYALDGRDPNTYTNILWCFGLHDRPWTERPVFGMVRYMNLAGMRRKTDVDAYIEEMQ
jgi:deoxyribodipyrimidine photo-lyase